MIRTRSAGSFHRELTSIEPLRNTVMQWKLELRISEGASSLPAVWSGVKRLITWLSQLGRGATNRLALVVGIVAVMFAGHREGNSAEAAEKIPGAVDLRAKFEKWGLPIRAQGSRGTCSVFTMTGAIEYALASRQSTGTVMSVEYLNWSANQLRRHPRDGGFFSELLAGFKAYGICAEAAMPYRAEYDPNFRPAASILALAGVATNAALQVDWIKRWDVTTGLTPAEFQEIKRVMVAGWPVCAGLRWPKHEAWRGKVLQMASPMDVFDGHSVLLSGFKDDPEQPGGGVFLIRNSGGGVRDGALPYDYVRAYANDAVWIGVGKTVERGLKK